MQRAVQRAVRGSFVTITLSSILALSFAGCGDDSAGGGGSSCPDGYIRCGEVCID
ncbi:unnamed protein product, partial [marine sediment metagenome]